MNVISMIGIGTVLGLGSVWIGYKKYEISGLFFVALITCVIGIISLFSFDKNPLVKFIGIGIGISGFISLMILLKMLDDKQKQPIIDTWYYKSPDCIGSHCIKQ